MKQIIIILLTLSLGISCQNSKKVKKIQETKEIISVQPKKAVQKTKKLALNVNYNSDNIDFIESDFIENVNIGGNNMFSFKFVKDEDSLHLIKINIYLKDKIFQTIEANKETYSNKHQFIDWNFDGYKDITVLYNCGATGLCAYWVWNYNPKINKFTYNKEISERLGMEIDSASKQIISHYREGWQHEFWSFYRYKGAELKLTKHIDRQFYNYEGVHWNVFTTEKLVNSEVIMSRDSVIIDKTRN